MLDPPKKLAMSDAFVKVKKAANKCKCMHKYFKLRMHAAQLFPNQVP